MASIRKEVAACAVALSVLTGCSGGAGSQSARSTAASAGDVATSTTSAPSVDTRFTGENSARFCTMARTYSERFADIGANATPAQLRTVAAEGQTSITQVVDAAPGEIKNDVAVVARTFGAFLGDLDKVGFDVAKLPLAAFNRLTASDFQASTARFEAYIRTVCGGT